MILFNAGHFLFQEAMLETELATFVGPLPGLTILKKFSHMFRKLQGIHAVEKKRFVQGFQ